MNNIFKSLQDSDPIYKLLCMNNIFKTLAGLVMASMLIATVFSISGYVDQQSKMAHAYQNEVAANVLTDLGHVQFRQAGNELTAAQQQAATDGIEAAMAMVLLMLGAVVWLLADMNGKQRLTVPAPRVAPQ